MKFMAAVLMSVLPGFVLAAENGMQPLDLTGHWVGLFAIVIFILAYLLVMAEEFTHLRKSKPVILAAGIIWAAIAWVYVDHGLPHMAEHAVRHNLLEYAELMLFLLVAMTYINAMDERRVFEALRGWLVARGFGFRSLFWITGILAFFISPIADNLTTALLMCAVVLSVGGDNSRFVTLACINIVVAANAGGAFSPFGDITTLMVWQKGVVGFWTFFALFLPSALNFLVPATIMSFAVPDESPVASQLKKTAHHDHASPDDAEHDGQIGDVVSFDVFRPVARAEWDTLLFFYGVVACVGGLGFIGYLGMASELIYTQWGATAANVSVGLLSAIVDNIPVMFAVLTMQPDMSIGQWLLVTLTAGVGGSLLSIGSAAGVALMGQARGKYTFFGHLKWSPVVALGYVASIYAHMWINEAYFQIN